MKRVVYVSLSFILLLSLLSACASEPSLLIRDVDVVSSIRASYYTEGEHHLAGYPLEAHIQQVLLVLLVGETMQEIERRPHRDAAIGFPAIEDTGFELVFALPQELVTMRIEPQRGLVATSSGMYEVIRPAELFAALLEILGYAALDAH